LSDAQNPYELPASIDTGLVPPAVASSKTIRWMSGILAVAGLIYLPSIIWFIFIPGGIVWLCWALIAFGVLRLNNNIFWTCSLLWNGGWLAFFVSQYLKHPPGPILLVIHCTFAVLFSIVAIVLNATENEKRQNHVVHRKTA